MKENRILGTNGAILNTKELEIYLEKISSTHNLKATSEKQTYPIPRLLENYRAIKEVYELLNDHLKLGIAIHPAGEWLLDNFYIIEETVKTIEKELTLKKYKKFVSIENTQYKGFARVYVLASEIINFTDNKIDSDDLERYLAAYQTKKTLNMDEIWSIGIFLQIAIIENIRQICERIYISQIEKFKVESIIERLVEKIDKRKYKNLKINKRLITFFDVRYPFIEYMSYKLKKYGKKTEAYLNILEEEVEKTGTNVSEVIKREHFDIALRKVSIENCIKSIKKIQRINFLEIFEKINGVEEILKLDPANVYEHMDYKTKDYYRQNIKEISSKIKISEIYIVRKMLEIAQKEKGKKSHIGYYLFGKNRNILYEKLGYKSKKAASEKNKEIYYISTILLFTILITLLATIGTIRNISIVASIITFILLLIPISEFVIQIIQYVLSKIVKPKLIPKLDFYNGINKENTTLVVIPTIIKDKEKVKELMRKLEVFYCGNKSDNLYFCLLGDCSESTKKIEPFDTEVVEEGKLQAHKLNEKYKTKGFPIFHFIYRKRIWNDKEEKYLGWERKRGALTELVEFLLGKLSEKDEQNKYYINTIKEWKQKKDEKNEFPHIKYIITLDSDTDLILNSAFELVGAMSHILNKPEIKNGIVSNGYALIQPRVGVNIDVSYKNLFTKIFAGSGGIDSYTNAISDIYQDNFEQGIFTGKGIFDIQAFHQILKNEIPENTVLSHDLLEGCYLRCGLASDILIMDGYPTKYLSFTQRLSRWIRGDWQIVRWLRNKKLNLISKFKIFDNLRRSLFEISTILSLIYLVLIKKIYNINTEGIITFLFIVVLLPFILEIINRIIFKKEGEQKQKTFTPKIDGFAGAIYRGIITLGCLPYKAYVSLKSIVITVYRMCFSKKHLLEWTTSEEAEKQSKTDILSYYKTMYINAVFGIITIIFALLTKNIVSLLIGLLWILIPSIMCIISKEKDNDNKLKLKQDEKDYLLEVAKKTFAYFEDNLVKENNYLIPDNYQEDRRKKYVDRTSSTNIGLSLLAVISGIDMNFISFEKGFELLKNIIDTIESLEKWNGHLYNWYNIETKKPLIPKYISTVDSGNFVGYLYVTKAYLLKKLDNNLEVEIKRCIETITRLINDADFSKLYNYKHRLFSIGFNIEENKLTDSYYDLLASEARQASLVAIAKKDVPAKHWNSLSRTLTIMNNKKGLISWSGTAFEYLMPNINIPRFKGSLLDESNKFAIMSQIEYAKRLNIPWGISEAAFNVKDLHSNYQYKAFGIPWLGLKRGLADEFVVSSYGSILALEDEPINVYKNMKKLEKYNMYNKYGFYESLDFTPERLERDGSPAVVKTYMAHHQALILLSINNFLNKNVFQKRFMVNPEIEAVSILLQERMPETFVVTKEEKETPTKLKYQDYENYAEITYNKTDENLIRGNVISNENYMIAINQKGQGFSKYKNIYVNRFKPTNEYNQGIFFYIKNIKDKNVWTTKCDNTITTFAPDQDKFETTNNNIKTTLKITLDSEEPVEIRRLEVENIGLEEEILEISTVLEPIISRKEQDYAHPAFNDLFLEFSYNNEEKILEVMRNKREENEKNIYLLTKFSTEAEVIVDNEFETSKEKLNERGNFGIPTAIINSTPFSNKVGLTTEPIIAMKKTIKIYPKEKISLDFILSINEDKDVALANLKKYNNSENVRRAFEISKAKSDAESRYLGIKGKDIILYQKILSYIIFDNPIKRNQIKKFSNKLYNQSDLWKYGISGDVPIILVKIKDANDVYMIKPILKMYEFFKTKNIDIDILFLDEEKHSYENYVINEIESKILDMHLNYMKNVKGGIFVLSKNEIDNSHIELFNIVAAIVIDSHKGDLEHLISDKETEYLNSISKIDDEIFEEKNITENEEQIDILKEKENLKYYNEYGAFSPDGKEYLICINKNKRLPTVWCNILANEKFGTVITENMGGYTWYKNSRLNRVSNWYNKAFLDIPSEVIYLQDKKNGDTWSLGLNPKPDDNNYNIVYGFGYAKYIHQSNDLMQEFEVFVPNEDSIKVGILKLNNKSVERKKIKIVYYIKPVLGEDELKSTGYIKVNFDNNANLVEAENIYEANFKNKIYISSSEKIRSYTGDQNSFLGKGGIVNPDGLKKYKLNGSDGIGKKACIAVEIEVEIDSLSSKEIVLNLGAEENIVDLKNTAYKYSKIQNCKQELENVKKKWKDLLEKIQVYTPLESMNIILNGWCLYQTLVSRMIGRTGFYQSGGAFGYRDQLQDTLALRYIKPEITKNQIIKHSKHQFIEGDVEHWWHDETQRGIRTKFSDDLAWLPFLVEKYIEVTGDKNILNIETPYIEGNILGEGEDEKYDLYPESKIKETIYMHCIRAIDKAINIGERGLPKIGSGDWNDGFSKVGNKGRGESVWLGFFLYLVLDKFIPICEEKGDIEKANQYLQIKNNLKKALNSQGWDGRWYRRAYTDDGYILGSIENEECRIDSIAQSWSIISGAGDNDKKFISIESLENHLVDKEHGIIKLLDPPFINGKIDPGYIKSYLPGVRENGGQYTHVCCC